MTRHWRSWFLVLLPALACVFGASDYWLRADESDDKAAAASKDDDKEAKRQERKRKREERKLAKTGVPRKYDPNEPLAAPPNWPPNHPLPQVASNCARCHLTAGRELTLAVKDFAHSVHDLNQITCNDCHGGNTEDNISAHENEFGFIGTKLSAHIARCSDCHTEAAIEVTQGPHNWDFSKRINTKFPMCIDCHGNHDVGNPPEDFKLADVCADCHKDMDAQWPQIASVVHENDKLWQSLLGFRTKLGMTTSRAPAELQTEIDVLRHDTMLAIHQSKEITPDRAKELNARAAALRAKIAAWQKK